MSQVFNAVNFYPIIIIIMIVTRLRLAVFWNQQIFVYGGNSGFDV